MIWNRERFVIKINKKFSIQSLIVVFVAVIGAFYYIIPSGRYTIPAMMMCLGGSAFILLTCTEQIIRPIMKIVGSILMISFLFLLITYPFDFEKAVGIITQQFLFIFPVILLYLSQKYKCNNAIIGIITCAAVMFVTFTTWTALTLNPTIARLLASGSSATEDLMSYRLANIGGFGFSYGMLFMAIGAFYVWDRINKSVLTTSIMIISTIFVFKTQYLTAILLMVVCYYLIIILKGNVEKKKIAIFGGLVILYFLAPFILESVSENIESAAMAKKVRQIADLLTMNMEFGQKTGGLYGRMAVYEVSIRSFSRSPIWGNSLVNAYNVVGEHSSVFDMAAKTGIIGLSAYLICIKQISNILEISFTMNGLDGKKIKQFIMIPYILLSILNPTLNIFEISYFSFFVCPIFIIWQYRKRY